MPTTVLNTSTEWPDLHSSLPEYAARFPGKLGSWILRRQTEALIQAMSVDHKLQSSNGHAFEVDAVDVGGGHGQVTPTLLELEKRVVTIVSDSRATQTLKEILIPMPPPCTSKLTIVTAPLDNLPFEPKTVPLVISLRMVCHIKDWKNYIKELCRVSATQVIIDYPSLRSVNYFQKMFFKAKLKVEGNTRDFAIFNDQEIANEFHQNGFTKIRLYRQFTLPLALHRALQKPRLSAQVERVCARVGVTDLIGSPVILSATKQ